MLLARPIAFVALLTVLAGTASASTSDKSVWFRRAIITGVVGVDICFRGDFPRAGGEFDRRFDLPVSLVITMGTIKARDQITERSRSLSGSTTTFRFNLKQVNIDPVGFAFYKLDVMPNGIDPCVELALVNSAPAAFGRAATITGELGIRVASAGQYLGLSRWVWKIETYGARVIWEGTDNFINICVNGAYTLRSKNGRLYCIQPAASFKSLRRVS